ncbi:MAG: hypothetical protein JNL98_09455 [Bryobacterales bacterium]|nr:hypothetical protein [Bryobacterales bacterium]
MTNREQRAPGWKTRPARGLLRLMVCVLSPLCGSALDPGRAISEYQYDVWQAREGLTYGAIHSLAQTPDGYLWLGTEGGLVRFNGAEFVLFSRSNTGGLIDGKVWDLSVTPRGDLLVVSTSGAVITRVQRGRFAAVAPEHGTARLSVRAALETRTGDLWVGTFSNGLIHIRGPKMRRLGSAQGYAGQRVKFLREDRAGNVWVATDDRGAIRIPGGDPDAKPADASPSSHVRRLHEDASGVIWMATLDQGLLRFHGGAYQRIDVAGGLSSNRVLAVCSDRDGQVWAGAEGGGLDRISGTKVDFFGVRQGLVSSGVRMLYEDREGSVWIGSDDGSLGRLGNRAHAVFSTPDGLSHDSIRSVHEDPTGVLWVGTAHGLSRREGRAFRPAVPELAGEVIASLAGDARDLWIGLSARGLRRLKGGVLSEVRELAGQTITALQLRQGRLWATTLHGSVFELDALTGKVEWSTHGLSAATTVSAGRDLWIGTNAGLLRRNAGGTLERGPELDAPIVTSLLEDEYGVWAGTNRGLRLLHGDRVTDFRRAGLPDRYILQVVHDGSGHLWLSTDRGVYRVPLKSLHAFAEGRIPRIEPGRLAFVPAAGSSVNGYYQPAGCRSHDGRLWFATVRGLLSVDPARLEANPVPPPVVIEGVRSDGREVAGGAEFVADADTWELSVHFAALSFADPGRITYRYRLEGYDRDWSEVQGRHSATYLNLPHGRYRFVVAAANSDGVWNEQGASTWIRKKPHLYQTAWFSAALAALLAGAGWLVYRRRVAMVKRQFAAVLEERTRIARELHDTLEQGLAGTHLHLDALLESGEGVGPKLRPALELTRSMVRYCMREAHCAVRDLRSEALERGGLESALREVAEQFGASDSVVCRVETQGTPRTLPAATEAHLLRIGQESITNAVRHGRATEIVVRLRFAERETTLRVEDNGCGMSRGTPSGGPHFGILGMQERANKLGGVLTLESAPLAGTTVQVTAPHKGRDQ